MSSADTPRPLLTVRKAAEALGVTPRTLKYYEERGLATPSRSNGRYRLYDEEDLKRFSRILRLRSAGFSLHAVAEIIARPGEIAGKNGARYLSEASLRDIQTALLERITTLDERLLSLQREKKELEGIRNDVRQDLDYIQGRLAGEEVDVLLAARASLRKARKA